MALNNVQQLNATGVTPGAYTNANVTVGADGRLTTAANGATGGTVSAWVNWDGVAGTAIRGSGNVSSITDFGTGDFGVNFTTSVGSAVYAVTGACADNNGGSTPVVVWINTIRGVPTASTVFIGTRGTNNAVFDSAYVTVAIIK